GGTAIGVQTASLIYFDKDLQNTVQHLFHTSLVHAGILCLGSKEGLSFTDYSNKYIELDTKNRIYKRKL
ncbi:MAG: hypothetical protein WD512_09105, partial [Candidatus Paceibacterota bacterium]